MLPALGRFTSIDPENAGEDESDAQSWNMYAYARNNPMLYTDSSGENYVVCDEHGENCSDQTDDQFEENKQDAQRAGEVWKNGQIFVPDDNGDLQFKGTFLQTDVDLSPTAQAIADDVGTRGAAMMNDTFKDFAINAALAAGGELAYRGYKAIRALHRFENHNTWR